MLCCVVSVHALHEAVARFHVWHLWSGPLPSRLPLIFNYFLNDLKNLANKLSGIAIEKHYTEALKQLPDASCLPYLFPGYENCHVRQNIRIGPYPDKLIFKHCSFVYHISLIRCHGYYNFQHAGPRGDRSRAAFTHSYKLQVW